MPKPPPSRPPSQSPKVLELYSSDGGLKANVQRVDKSTIWCSIVIAPDGTLTAVAPNGEWLVAPPAAQMEGQQALDDPGEEK